MNDVIKLLKNHRSNRSFVKGHKLLVEELDSIIEATKQAPSWMNGQHYSIIVIDDENLKNKIYSLLTNNQHIDTSSVFLLFCADLTRQKLASEIHNGNFDIENNVDTIITMTTYVSLAMQNAIIASESLGYGTVCCGGIRLIAKELIELLGIPKYAYPICGLSIGKLDEELTTERVKPRFDNNVNVGFNKFPISKIIDIENYDNTMEIFAEARETKLWSKKFSDFYTEKPIKVTNELIKKQGF